MRDFNYTVNVLVKAYLNNELAHRSCTACAVGNIIAESLGTKPKPDTDNIFTGFDNNRYQNGYLETWFDIRNMTVRDCSQVRMTGYYVDELRKIEYAFENCDESFLQKASHERNEYFLENKRPIGQDDEWMFKGLMAVVDVLAEIHNVDLSTKENAKLLFVK